ncbi:hypothetical protein HFN49_35960 [Rhizobium leguminosarum]|uniref:hypothetical protein n=1 Tax=Rhizobium ruizarguesonis TaxID=2081791 RepID=UPI001A99828A|nr:hypothetical protein [Rhizobium ruizarguesonis]MBY5891540.1 hypothetical protein [Rhizobium leguminosarum]QSZ05560.1 hypothetical protein J3P73_36995 [Rhizobium ruizarguesonis]
MEHANFTDEEVKAVLEHFQKTTPSTFKETKAKLVELGLASEAGLLNARGQSIVSLLQGPATYTKEVEMAVAHYSHNPGNVAGQGILALGLGYVDRFGMTDLNLRGRMIEHCYRMSIR